jgi:hypothetical protein
VAIVGEMAIRMSFASRGSKRREWRRSGLTRTSTILPMVYMSLVCRCPGPRRVWGQFGLGESGRLLEVLLPRLHRSDRCGAPVRPVQAWTDNSLGFVLVQVRGLFLEVVVLVVGLESLQEVRLLGILPLGFTTGMGGVVALRRRGGMAHGFSFVVLVFLQAERVGSLMVVTVVVFVEVALVGKMVWFVLTSLSIKWLGTGFALLVLTPVLSHLFAQVLIFEF